MLWTFLVCFFILALFFGPKIYRDLYHWKRADRKVPDPFDGTVNLWTTDDDVWLHGRPRRHRPTIQ